MVIESGLLTSSRIIENQFDKFLASLIPDPQNFTKVIPVKPFQIFTELELNVAKVDYVTLIIAHVKISKLVAAVNDVR